MAKLEAAAASSFRAKTLAVLAVAVAIFGWASVRRRRRLRAVRVAPLFVAACVAPVVVAARIAHVVVTADAALVVVAPLEGCVAYRCGRCRRVELHVVGLHFQLGRTLTAVDRVQDRNLTGDDANGLMPAHLACSRNEGLKVLREVALEAQAEVAVALRSVGVRVRVVVVLGELESELSGLLVLVRLSLVQLEQELSLTRHQLNFQTLECGVDILSLCSGELAVGVLGPLGQAQRQVDGLNATAPLQGFRGGAEGADEVLYVTGPVVRLHPW